MKLSRFDPRVKLLMTICLSSAALICRDLIPMLALLLFCLFVMFTGGIMPALIWRKLRGLFSLIASLFILQCIFNRRGEPILTLHRLTLLTDVGLRTAAVINLRLLIIVLSALIILSGEARDYLLALTQLKVPYEIAFMVLIAMRFLPLLHEEARDVMNAAQMRGLRLRKAGLKNKVAAYLSLSLPVLAGAVKRVEQTSIAMEARGFRAMKQRTSMRRLYMSGADWTYAFAFCIMLGLLLFLFNM